MRSVSVVLLLVAATMASASNSKGIRHFDVANAQALFDEFVKENNRQYKDEADRAVHLKAFTANLEKINKLNEQNPSALYGINKFADYTEEERQGMFGLRKKP